MTMDTATERTGPIGTLILITDDEMRDILTHIDLPLTLEGTDR